jgi:hypothetical protein
VSLYHLHIVFARGGDGPPPRFISLIEHECRARGMSFEHCRSHDHAEAIRAALLRGELSVDLLIDYMGRSFRHDEDLGRAVRAAGGLPVEDPERVRAYGSKATMHLALARAGVPLPRTVIWPAGRPARDLTPTERALLGEHLVVKPARTIRRTTTCCRSSSGRWTWTAARPGSASTTASGKCSPASGTP